jgi:hypothetical protein
MEKMENSKQSAFPTMEQNQHVGLTGKEDGLNKREYFAAKAMNGLLAADAKYGGVTNNYKMLAEDAVAHADALLSALAKQTDVKKKIKLAEKKIKERNKPKTLIISGDIPQKVKKYCTTFNLNIGEWVENILVKEIEKNNCVILEEGTSEEILDKLSLEISEKYLKEYNKERILFKSNKLLMSSSLKFYGYSLIDSNPIYEFLGKDIKKIQEFFKLNDIEAILVNKSEVSKGILYNEKLQDFTHIEI